MSAPDTNVEVQETQHKPALIGIRGAVIFGAAMLIMVIAYAFMGVDEAQTLSTGATETSPVVTDPYLPGTNASN